MLLGAALCALTPAMLQAQSSNKLVMDVPFNFQVQNQMLPAGEYSIVPTSGPTSAITLRSVSNPALSCIVLTLHAQDNSDQPSRAIFHRYGNRYFLAQIFSADQKNGWDLSASKAEREARAGVQLAKETIRLTRDTVAKR